MRLLRKVLVVLLALTVIGVAVYLTGNYEVMERLTELFLSLQLAMPVTFSFEQFLALLATVSLIVVFLTLVGCAALLALMNRRHAKDSQEVLIKVSAAKKEVDHVKEQYRRQYEQLQLVGQSLTKRLDKRVLIQSLIEVASRLTSGSQANSIASFWLLNPESDTFRFEMGLYCDETLFTKTEFQPTEQPFARVVSSQKVWALPSWQEEAPFVKPDKLGRLGSSAGLIVVPCVVETRVQAVLVLFCHPDTLKSYEEQKAFYDVIWAELTLSAIIAIQGAVTIIDRLTGVHTREYFMARLIQEIERANRYQLPLSLLMIDIDNFKLVNDMLGHPQGDAVLKIIAKLLKKEVRAIDLVGRYGGEEFIVMLPETGYGEESASATGALVVAERIRKSVDDEFRGLQKPLDLTVSVGVAVRRFPEEREVDYRELVRVADEQLYRAKTTGKNKVCALPPEKTEPVT